MFHTSNFARVAKIEKWALTFAMDAGYRIGNVFASSFL
jgi:hypothetical protein